jgi:tetratricopeptide (TPR) repeat protein
MKIWSRLLPKDLRLFEADFKEELTRFLPGYDFQISLAPEIDHKAWTPLSYKGRHLGYVSFSQRDGCPAAPPDILKLWPQILEGALEKTALRKALITDRDTGLSNRAYFMGRLRRLIQPTVLASRPLSLGQGDKDPELILALAQTAPRRDDPAQSVLALARSFREIPELLCLARLGDRLLGIIFRAAPAEAQNHLDNLRAKLYQNRAAGKLCLAYASWPGDLCDELYGQGQDLRENPVRAAGLLLEKANSALFFAASKSNPAPVIGFKNILASHGQITQVLPQERVVINLGRSTGAAAGQIFLVRGQSGQPKGEISLFETGDGYSLAHVTSSESGLRLAAGDYLAYSRSESAPPQSPEESEKKAASGFQKESFQRNLIRLAQPDRPLALALCNLDEAEKLETMLGEKEVERRLAEVMEALRREFPFSPELLSPWDKGILAMAWPGAKKSELKPLLESFAGDFKSRHSISIGLVFWPSEVLSPEGLCQAAEKALLEAAMTGPATVISFGPQTLNIIGDHRYDDGDLDGALESYRQGLLLDPGHLNLLNSLGVCYGRLGDQKAAMSAFDDVLRQDPQNFMARFNKACSHLLVGKLEEAEESLEEAVKIQPDNFEALFHLGKTAMELGHLDKALAALEKASQEKGRKGPIWRLLGQARLSQGDQKGAMAAYKQALKFSPDDAHSLSALGVLYKESGDNGDVALSLFRRSVELDPTNSLYRQRLGRLLYDLGDFSEAEHHLKSALDYSGKDSPDPGGQVSRGDLSALKRELENQSQEVQRQEGLEEISSEGMEDGPRKEGVSL